jgi:hypothetical protein
MSDADNERRSRRACRPWRWAIAQIPFEAVRNWMSNDRAFRPEFFRAFDRAKAIAARKRIKKLTPSA